MYQSINQSIDQEFVYRRTQSVIIVLPIGADTNKIRINNLNLQLE